ncbi:MAG: quinone oxidoreductase [Gammaproteobacteria bacterium]|nr:quinone oxidoreductase [Gammaproteobacteria bacterium]
MSRATATSIRIHRHGAAEVLQAIEVGVGEPDAGEIRVRHTAIGLNYIDTYHRSGLYPTPLPSGLGMEAAGVVEAVGAGIDFLAVGDRIAYAGGPLGAYCQVRLLPAAKAVKLPADIGDDIAAALLLKGMTAWYLLHQTFAVKPGTTVLIHAAAGGVGSLLVPWARQLGARVIGTAGGPEKCRLAREYGCHEVIDYLNRDFVTEVRQRTDGAGVDVAYDSVGRDTFIGSLDCLRRRGLMVSFGNASGKPPAVEPGILAAKGSLYLTRPTLADYTATREELDTASGALFAAVRGDVLHADIRQRYPLRDVARAHTELAARMTCGTSLLIP